MGLEDSQLGQHFQNVKSSQSLYFLNSVDSEAAFPVAPGGHLWPAVFGAAHVLLHCENRASLLTEPHSLSEGMSHLSLGMTHQLNVTVCLQHEGPSDSVY